MKFNRRDVLLTVLGCGVIYLVSYHGTAGVLRARRQHQEPAKLKMGPELGMVFVVSRGCAYCNDPELPTVVKRARELLSQNAQGRNWSFADTGAAPDVDADAGIEFLQRFGKFSELASGRAWLNVACLRYLKDLPGPMVTPELIVLSRYVESKKGIIVNERVVLRLLGLSAIRKWTEAGAPLPSLDDPTPVA